MVITGIFSYAEKIDDKLPLLSFYDIIIQKPNTIDTGARSYQY